MVTQIPDKTRRFTQNVSTVGALFYLIQAGAGGREDRAGLQGVAVI